MYQPKPPPANPDVGSLASHIDDMAHSIAQAQHDAMDSVRFSVLHVAPKRPRAGDVAYADGSDWNPGNGAGLYVYGTAWTKVGPQVTGTAVLVAGTKVVTLASITANSRIFLTSNVDGGAVGFLRVSARVVGTSFTITSSSATDTSTVAYLVIEP